MYGTEYENPLFTTDDYNVPCAVCYTSKRSSKLMIPAKLSCSTSWTEEYEGYLMAEKYNSSRNAAYECVDKCGKTVSGSSASIIGASFYHVVVTCYGLPCAPYVTTKQLPVWCVLNNLSDEEELKFIKLNDVFLTKYFDATKCICFVIVFFYTL